MVPGDAGLIRLDLAGIHTLPPGPSTAILELRHAESSPFGVTRARITILALAPTTEFASSSRFASAQRINATDSILIPGLINAHTHLDLTHIGAQPHNADRGFVGFVDLVRAHRASDDEAIARSVSLGIERSLRGGVVGVGDIAGAPRGTPSLVPFQTLAESPLFGTSFLEFFAIGKGEATGMAAIARAVAEAAPRSRGERARLGLQPHATNTVSPRAYGHAITLSRAHDFPLSTHLAETLEEREFIAHASGPQRELLERLGAWDDSILESHGHGRTPVEHLSPILSQAPFIAAHVNDATDADLERLARTHTTVAYCPRAHDYFGARDRLGPHRYTQMIRMGVPVALATDSVINLDPSEAWRLTPLDDARLLYQRDGTNADLLMEMITTTPARAIGLDPTRAELREGGKPYGLALVAVAPDAEGAPPRSPACRVLESMATPELFCIATR
ncbi:MAG: amidohydrolase family protein [Phycisphaerales bacterium]|nr:MAG: amidohydrolase family protein [Phycisphaerales bacterium]